jgi:hypothetical protein
MGYPGRYYDRLDTLAAHVTAPMRAVRDSMLRSWLGGMARGVAYVGAALFVLLAFTLVLALWPRPVPPREWAERTDDGRLCVHSVVNGVEQVNCR